MGALAKSLDSMVKTENRSIAKLESAYMRHGRQKTYIALEEINFVWCTKEIERFQNLWESNLSLDDISKELNRPIDDVFILAFDQAREGKIKSRKGGLLGDAI